MQIVAAILLIAAYVAGAVRWIRTEGTRRSSALATSIAVLGGIALIPIFGTIVTITKYLLIALLVIVALIALDAI